MAMPVSTHEPERLAALRRYQFLDHAPDPALDRITRMTARIFAVPIALVSIVDAKHHWCKSAYGLNVTPMPRERSLCAQTILNDGVLIVPDIQADPYFAVHPFAADTPDIRFYAAAPLITSDGYHIGTLCIMDTRARRLSADETATLTDLAAQVIDEFELRQTSFELMSDINGRLQIEAALRESEERLRLALQAAKMGIWDWDIASDTITWSAGTSQLFGLEPEQRTLSYQAFLNCIHPDDRRPIQQPMTQPWAADPNLEQEYRVVWPDGSIHWIVDKGQVFHDESGRVVRMLGMVMDISERKRAEHRLHTLYATISAPQVSFEAKVTQLLAMGCAAFGLDSAILAQYQGAHFEVNQSVGASQALKPGQTLDIATPYWHATISAEQPISYKQAQDMPVPRYYKHLISPIEAYLGTRIMVGGEVYGILSFFSSQARHDMFTRQDEEFLQLIAQWISNELERRQAELALHESEYKYRSIVDNLKDVVFQTNRQGEWTFLSPAWTAITGFSIQESLETSVLRYVYADDRQSYMDVLHHLLGGRHSQFRQEIRLLTNIGNLRWVELYAHRMVAGDASVTGIAGTLTDITERKQSEALAIGQKHILELMTLGVPLPEVLAALIRIIEEQIPSTFCSILLLGNDGVTLHNLGSPSLPRRYAEAIDGLSMGPHAGPCGLAAYSREPVIVTDIANDPRSGSLRETMLRHGLHACWSIPILSTTRQTLGTLALYYRQPHAPSIQELQLAQIATNMAAFVIEPKRVEEALRESEERYRIVAETASDAMITIDENGTMLFVNQAAERIFGYSKAEMYQQPFTMLTPAWLPNPYFLAIKRYMQGERQQPWERIELVGLCQDGTEIPLELSFGAFTKHGKHQFTCIMRDITERKQAENALRRSEATNRAFVNAIPDMMFRINRDGIYLDFIAAKADTLAVPPEALIGQNIYDVFPSLELQIKTCMEAVLQSGEMQILEYQFPIGDNVHHYEARVVISGEDEVLAIVRDITERKAAEAALNNAYIRLQQLTGELRRGRDVLRTLFDGLDDGLLLLDSRGQVLAANQAMAALFGSKPEQIVHQSWSALGGDTLRDSSGDVVMQTLRDGRPRRRRESRLSGENVHRILDVQTLPLVGISGSVDQVILHVADVTDRAQVEALMIQNERLAANGKLAATMAHEINTPLQSLRSCLYLAEKGSAGEGNKYLRVAREEIDRISGILRNLLDLHRPYHGLEVWVDLNALIDKVLLLTGSTLSERGIEVTRRLAPDLPPLRGHPDQLIQVLLNLTLNAMEAMPDGGELCLRTGEDDQSGAAALFVEISDSGVGIPAEIREQIFEPFFTTKPHGSGLGLAISHKIVAQHKGNIVIRSTPQVGTTFTMVFPLDAAAAGESGTSQ
jgi:PAS domain S-box-containing protein